VWCGVVWCVCVCVCGSQVIDPPKEETEDDGGAMDDDSTRQNKAVVIKTSTRQTIFLPTPGLVDPEQLRPSQSRFSLTTFLMDQITS